MITLRVFFLPLALLSICDAKSPYREDGPINAFAYDFCYRGSTQREPVTLNTGQGWEDTLPFFALHFNVTDIIRAESYFEFRTFDPEGLIFYGDTKDGEDNFILALRNGRLEVQINNEFTKVTKSEGPEINDGKWHKIEVKNVQNAIIVEVDDKIVLHIQDNSQFLLVDITGSLRITFGGLYTNVSQMLNPLQIQLDACIRNWTWLDQNTPSLTKWAETEQKKPCFSSIRKGSFFSGSGLAVFKADAFKGDAVSTEGQWTLSLEMMVRPIKKSAILLAVTTLDHKPLLTLILKNEEEGFSLRLGSDTRIQKPFPENLCRGSKLSLVISEKDITFQLDDQPTVQPIKKRDYETLKEAWLEKGSLFFLGGIPEVASVFPNLMLTYFHGCTWDIKVQGQNVDLDSAYYKHEAIWSHSCPTWDLLTIDME